MQVAATNLHSQAFTKSVVTDPAKQRQARPEPQLEPASPSPAAPVDNAEEQRGVIRLLEEGHFKGVADVRLRINFFEELTARAEQQSAASLPDNVDAFNGQVLGTFGETATTLGLSEDQAAAAQQLADDFTAAVNTARDAAVVEGRIDRNALDANLHEAFDGLIAGLRELTALPAVEPAVIDELIVDENGAEVPLEVTEPVAQDTETTDPTLPQPTTEQPEPAEATVADPFAPLVQTFENALAEFQQSLTADLRLPELTEPQNNGRAYERFLAIYNDLLGGNQPEAESESPSLELSA